MPELIEILRLWDQIESAGETGVLATVVQTRGSSYRLPGAHLLLAQSGEHAGTISGGCLEEEILRKAWWMTESGPVLRRYDTTTDGEIESSPYGLGCNGTIEVLLQRVSARPRSQLSLLRSVVERRLCAVIAHVIRPPVSLAQRLSIDVDGCVESEIADPALAEAAEESARTVQASGVSQTVAIGSAQVFIECLVPPVHLLVFGAGDDAVPMTRLAKQLGWRVSVFDGRIHYLKPGKFPDADSVMLRQTGAPTPAVDNRTVAVLMTHSYSQDLDILRSLAVERLPYLGILGPRKRANALLKEAMLDVTSLDSLHTPVGLDIGADGPEQVALAVCAEIQSVLNGRSGGFLKHREGSIHASESSDAQAPVWGPSAVCA